MKISFEFNDEELSADAKAMLAGVLGLPKPRAARGTKAKDKTTETPAATETAPEPPAPPAGDDADFGSAPATPPAEPSVDDLRAALSACAGSYGSDAAKGRDAAVGLMKKYGSGAAADIPADKRAALIAELVANHA